MNILIIGGVSRSLVNFRGPLIKAMLGAGHEVVACAGEPDAGVANTLRNWGVRFLPLKLARAGMNPLGDLRSFMQLKRVMREVKPDIVLCYTIKPVIWGGLAARRAGVPHVYSLITGLGYAFMHKPEGEVDGQLQAGGSFRQRVAGWIARRLYKLSLACSTKVFFQNPDDMQEFVALGLVSASKCVVISGSGVDLELFKTAGVSSQAATHRPVFLLIARLLADKGVREYAVALELLGSACRGLLAGGLDPNPASISQAELDEWTGAGLLEHLGYLSDVRPAYEKCSVYVLPSYREGTPRTVLEAMAMGRPIITTDAPGCRETIKRKAEGGNVEPEGKIRFGLNGILVPPRDAEALAVAMRFFIDNPEQIPIMGRESRRYAEERYDVNKVNAVMLREMGLKN